MNPLIRGVAGQEGGYLAGPMPKKGYEVVGSSRDAMIRSSDVRTSRDNWSRKKRRLAGRLYGCGWRYLQDV